MRLLLLNGNTNIAMTGQLAGHARLMLGDAVEVVEATARESVPYITSRRECALAAGSTLALVERHLAEGEFDAILLACFGEPGMAAVREITRVPVVGMLEASLLTALQLGQRFSIVTPGQHWPRMIEDVLNDLGVGRRCLGIDAVTIDDLQLPKQREQARIRLEAAIHAQLDALAPDVIIVGGAAFAGLAPELPTRDGTRLLDCFDAALVQARALGHLSAC
ncbi:MULTISPECIES: aspartate/glutamate racemase family protein [Halomonadaceae]|uniref:aspartate/glutamate racemase family protein n=1 Tax=Halomonadaceae TaxID=28256 RepID=UPI00159B2EB0|nr:MULTISPECIES: aspartate/glutamate racemase family protein [Halomonas]QJQ95542.1 hydrogenase expression protein HupH [Halomonas sp. PA5]